jgi:integrase
MIQLLLLTGARRDEVSHMVRGELDLDAKVWTLPAARAKNKREHIVHLSDAAVAILKALKPVKSDAGWCFTTNGENPVSGYSKAKIIVDRFISEAANGEAMDPWTFHDLRRTAATGMAGIGIAIPVIERALNHVSGTFGGLVGRYQHHDFAAERREAFQKWGDHVTRIVSPVPASDA